MAFVVEDGTGIANANAYIDVAFADSYNTDRLNSTWTDLTDQTFKEAAIIAATDYIDYRWDFVGRRKRNFEQQSLKWPRIGAFIQNENKEIQANLVPLQVQYAACEYALQAVGQSDTAGVLAVLSPPPDIDSTGGKIIAKKEEVGPVKEETRYSGSFGLITLKPYPKADNYLRDLVLHGLKVARG